jgi:hypothetical protein
MRQQLALVLDLKREVAWPPQTHAALVAALADLLVEALGAEEARSMTREVPDERQDHF